MSIPTKFDLNLLSVQVLEVLSDPELKKLSTLVNDVLYRRRVGKRILDERKTIADNINKRCFSLHNFDLGNYEEYHKYALRVDIEEYYEDHCLLHEVDADWFRLLMEIYDENYYFELDDDREDDIIYLYYPINQKLPPTNTTIQVIKPDGKIVKYRVEDTQLVAINHPLDIISKEQWVVNDWFFNIYEDEISSPR